MKGRPDPWNEPPNPLDEHREVYWTKSTVTKGRIIALKVPRGWRTVNEAELDTGEVIEFGDNDIQRDGPADVVKVAIGAPVKVVRDSTEFIVCVRVQPHRKKSP